jgi:hypothetical protein
VWYNQPIGCSAHGGEPTGPTVKEEEVGGIAVCELIIIDYGRTKWLEILMEECVWEDHGRGGKTMLGGIPCCRCCYCSCWRGRRGPVCCGRQLHYQLSNLLQILNEDSATRRHIHGDEWGGNREFSRIGTEGKTKGNRVIAPLLLDLSTRWRWVVRFTPRPQNIQSYDRGSNAVSGRGITPECNITAPLVLI